MISGTLTSLSFMATLDDKGLGGQCTHKNFAGECAPQRVTVMCAPQRLNVLTKLGECAP